MMNNILIAIQEALQEFSSFPLLRKKVSALKLSRDPYLLAIGKTAWLMTNACMEALQEKGLNPKGYLLTKYGHTGNELPGITQLEAGHPIPDENGLSHSKLILSWLQKLASKRILIVLISGGSSALFEVPLSGTTLQQIVKLNSNLLNSGLGISEMNKKRASFSLVKNGRALMQTDCRQVHVFCLSDVVNNDPKVIGSGSFFDPQSRQISQISYRYRYSRENCSYYTIIGDNLALRKLIKAKLKGQVVLDKSYQQATAEILTEKLVELARQTKTKTTYLLGGESPVKVSGNGRGGRCTHLALLFAKQVAGLEGVRLTAIASDGNDNLDGVSGTWVNGSSWDKIKAAGIDPDNSLTNCDSYTALKAIDAIIPTWKYPINVNDIYILEID